MATIIIGWEVAGDVQLRRAFTNLPRAFDNLRQPLRKFGDQVIYPATREQFAKEGKPRWPALSPAYAARKAKIAPGAKILHLTGAMEDSLTDKSAADALYRLDNLSLEIGSGLMVGDGRWNLALIHYKPERSDLPARRMMRLDENAQTKGVMLLHDWLSAQGRKEGIGL